MQEVRGVARQGKIFYAAHVTRWQPKQSYRTNF